MLLDGLGRADEARAAAETAIAISPTVSKRTCCSGCLSSTQGTSRGERRDGARNRRTIGSRPAIVAFADKQIAESDAALGRLIEAHHDTAAVQIAQAYAFRGERAKAFDWLDRAVVQRDPGLINIKTDPLFAGLRGDTRYKAVLRKMNLPE